VLSLATLDATFVGQGHGDWPSLTARLAALDLVDGAALPAIAQLWWFGRLIANTDMHAGNLGFRPGGPGRAHAGAPTGLQPVSPAPPLWPAPAYDMLPMAYAPLPGGELPPRVTAAAAPPLPLPQHRAAWLPACQAAIGFWQAVQGDARISDGMRQAAAGHARALVTQRDQA
jgi:hypothetical protein